MSHRFPVNKNLIPSFPGLCGIYLGKFQGHLGDIQLDHGDRVKASNKQGLLKDAANF
jgi:hypothetical protein